MEFYYMDLPFWRGRIPRLLIHLGGLEVKDHKFKFEEVAQLKSEGVAPFGQFPVLKVGDVTITQAVGIVRFLGRRAGFYPTDDVQAAKVDEAVLMFEELTKDLSLVNKVPEEEKEAAIRKMLDTSPLFPNINTLIGDKEFVVGDSMTIADMFAWSVFPFLEDSPFVKSIKKGEFDKYENIQRVIANVSKDPRVAEFMAA